MLESSTEVFCSVLGGRSIRQVLVAATGFSCAEVRSSSHISSFPPTTSGTEPDRLSEGQ